MALAGTLVPIPSIIITSGTYIVKLQASIPAITVPSTSGGESWG